MSTREEFEKWAEAQGYAIDQFGDDHGDRYRDEKTLRAWGAWQARQPEIDALRAELETATEGDAFELLRIWQTWLGASRRQCGSEGDKKLWDRIDAVLSTAPEPKQCT